MKIVNELEDQDVITRARAEYLVESLINSKTENLYVIKYKGEIISVSGEYYKFAWKNIGYLRNALSNKFGKELAEALVREGVIEVVKVIL